MLGILLSTCKNNTFLFGWCDRSQQWPNNSVCVCVCCFLKVQSRWTYYLRCIQLYWMIWCHWFVFNTYYITNKSDNMVDIVLHNTTNHLACIPLVIRSVISRHLRLLDIAKTSIAFVSYLHNAKSSWISSRCTALNVWFTYSFGFGKKSLHSLLGYCVRRTCLWQCWRFFCVCAVWCKKGLFIV